MLCSIVGGIEGLAVHAPPFRSGQLFYGFRGRVYPHLPPVVLVAQGYTVLSHRAFCISSHIYNIEYSNVRQFRFFFKLFFYVSNLKALLFYVNLEMDVAASGGVLAAGWCLYFPLLPTRRVIGRHHRCSAGLLSGIGCVPPQCVTTFVSHRVRPPQHLFFYRGKTFTGFQEVPRNPPDTVF